MSTTSPQLLPHAALRAALAPALLHEQHGDEAEDDAAGWPGPLWATQMLVDTISHLSRQGGPEGWHSLISAACGQPLAALLCLYEAIPHVGAGLGSGSSHGLSSSSAAGGGGPARAPMCCQQCHQLLSAMVHLCTHAPTELQELKGGPTAPAAPAPSRPSGGSGAALLPTPRQQRSPPTLDAGQDATLTLKPFPAGLVRAAQRALQHCQPCSVPDLAWDGSVRAYVQAKAPADPCPCGPAPAHKPQAASSRSATAMDSNGSSCSGGAADGDSSLLEKWVTLLGAVALSSKAAARQLHDAGALEVLAAVSEACRGGPGSLLEAVEAALGACARQCKAMAQELLDSPSVPALAGIAVHAHQPRLIAAALDRLTIQVDSCSGTEFAVLLRPGGVVARTCQLLLGSVQGEEPELHLRLRAALLLSCLDRCRHQAGLSREQVPRGHPWSLVRPRQLLALEKALLEGQRSTGSAPAAAAVKLPGATRGAQDITPAAQAEALGPSASPRATHKKQAKQALAHTAARQAGPSGRGSSGGASTGRKKQGATASGPRTGGTSCSERGNDADAEENDGDDEDEDGLRVVWDSAPPAAVRAVREAWRAVPLRERVAWSQTSDEVNVWIKLPQGTLRKQVTVDVEPQRLCVKLGWYGRFLEGELTRRIKSRDSTWCLTGLDDMKQFEVLHVMMPKDDLRYWRSLFVGSEQKSHMELLKEAVEADEPSVGYDDMDEGAREIYEDLRERQAMVSCGMIDLERSFDDFRVVIGDGTL